tara:strand:+ start:246 stop:554 length:309 start_codon:yes stop_codon:yes gene_type:complete
MELKMKSYIQGMITGGAIVLSFMILLGNNKNSRKKTTKTYRTKLIEMEDRIGMLEGSVNERFKMVGENFIYLKNQFAITVNSEYDFKSTKLINDPFPFKHNE